MNNFSQAMLLFLFFAEASCAFAGPETGEIDPFLSKGEILANVLYVPSISFPDGVINNLPEYSLIGSGDVQLPWQDAPVPYLAVGDLTVSSLRLCDIKSGWVCFHVMNNEINFVDFSIPVAVAYGDDSSANGESTDVWDYGGYRYEVVRRTTFPMFHGKGEDVWISIKSYELGDNDRNRYDSFVWSMKRGLIAFSRFHRNGFSMAAWATADYCGFGGVVRDCVRQ